jgi:hypothetical protein
MIVRLGLATALIVCAYLLGFLAGLWVRRPMPQIDPHATLDGTRVIRALRKQCRKS